MTFKIYLVHYFSENIVVVCSGKMDGDPWMLALAPTNGISTIIIHDDNLCFSRKVFRRSKVTVIFTSPFFDFCLTTNAHKRALFY